MRLPVARRCPSMGTIAWKTTIGWPFASLRTPGSPRMTAASCLLILPWPCTVPRVVRTTPSGRTLAACCSRAPVPMASIETNTPTAQVTPITIVSAEPIRCAMPARLTNSRAESWRRNLIAALAAAQCSNDVQACSPDGRHGRADQRDQGPAGHSERHNLQGHGNAGHEPRGKRKGEEGERQSETGSHHAYGRGFREDEQEQGTLSEAERLEHGELGCALAYRLHQHRGRGEEQCDQHCAHDGANEEIHVADGLQLQLRQLPQRFGARRMGGIGEAPVDSLGHARRLPGI